MIEFVLVVGVFVPVILGLTFFFGWAMKNKHEVVMANRYAAWQRVLKGSWPSDADLNQKFFDNRARVVTIDTGSAGDLTIDDLVRSAGSRGARPQLIADELIRNKFPRGRRVRVSAEFDSSQSLWQRFKGAITFGHGREGLTWRRDEVNCWGTLRDLYYSDLDQSLQQMPAPADGMARMIRGLYLTPW